jgi:hypothetical protein
MEKELNSTEQGRGLQLWEPQGYEIWKPQGSQNMEAPIINHKFRLRLLLFVFILQNKWKYKINV